MKRKVMILTCAALLAAAGTAGCGIFFEPSYTPVRNYDLLPPTPIVSSDYCVSVLPCTSEAPARYKMVMRSGVELFQDEYNRWSQTPAVMLTRYLRLAFTGSSDIRSQKVPEYELSCSVLVFEADSKARTVLLGVRYTIADHNVDKVLCTGILRYSVPLNDQNKPFAKAMAEAMSEAAQRLAVDLSGVMRSFNKKK